MACSAKPCCGRLSANFEQGITVRLFVAINPPERVREQIASGTQELRNIDGIRWVDPGAVHLTLKFIGEADEDAAREVAGVLHEVAARYGPFEARLTAPGAFPNFRRPRVVWFGLEGGEDLLALQEDLEEALASLGIEQEGRAFRPHLTLGRARRGRRIDGSKLDAVARRTKVSGAWHVRGVELMRSHLRPTGAEHEVWASAELTGHSDEARMES